MTVESQGVSCTNRKRPDGMAIFLGEWESAWCRTLRAPTPLSQVTLMSHLMGQTDKYVQLVHDFEIVCICVQGIV